MDRIKPEIFYEKFGEVLKLENLNIEKYTSKKELTKFMNDTIPKIGEILGFKNMIGNLKEFKKIDFTFFNETNTVITKTEKYWNFEIAVEHENEETAWWDEFRKLMRINCGLKVIISYHNYSTGCLKKRLKSQILPMYNVNKYKQIPDNWLLIIGPTSNPKTKTIEGKYKDYRAFKFYGKEFHELDQIKILEH